MTIVFDQLLLINKYLTTPAALFKFSTKSNLYERKTKMSETPGNKQLPNIHTLEGSVNVTLKVTHCYRHRGGGRNSLFAVNDLKLVQIILCSLSVD